MENTISNEEKKPIVTKYPCMIWSAVRQGKAVSCSEDLNCPSESDTRNAPLEMHSGYSVFRIAIAKSDGSLTANIPARDVPYILEEYRFQRDLLRKREMQEGTQSGRCKEPAYSVAIPDRNCGNRPAAEVLQQPNGEQLLNNARKYLESNLSKYPKNQRVIDAIDQTIALKNSGKLLKVSQMRFPPVYHRDFKPKKNHKNQLGYSLIYFIDISAHPGEESPWIITVSNCYSPLKEDGIPNMEKAVDYKKYSFQITQEEMDLLIYRMKATMELFERSMFVSQYKTAQKYKWTADNLNPDGTRKNAG